MSLRLPDMTQALQETTLNGAGSQRWQRPVYVDLLAPCNHACPAGENIQAWLAQAQAGQYEKAWQALVDDDPLPSTHGRACYHPCESSCNRASLDAPIAIRAVERFLGDLAADKGWGVSVAPRSGKKILVVGAGPSGLACAYHLARMGHQAEIRNSAEKPCEMMAFGIPVYRLPRTALRNEIDRIMAMPGIGLKCGKRVGDVIAEKLKGGFDAVFVAVGAQEANHLNIPEMDGEKITDAVSLPGGVKEGKAPKLGALGPRADLELSTPYDIRLPLMWIALLSRRLNGSLAATTGVWTRDEVVKYLLAGADAVMTTSVLLKHGPDHLTTLVHGLRDWMQSREFASVAAFKGRLAARRPVDAAGFMRAQYRDILTTSYARLLQ